MIWPETRYLDRPEPATAVRREISLGGTTPTISEHAPGDQRLVIVR
jgi:hypothetical protein